MYREVFPHLLICLLLLEQHLVIPEGSFLVPEIGILFGHAVGASLVRGPWLPPRGCYVICDVAVCSWCEQHDSREYLSGASNKPPGRHQIQNAEGPVLVPCAKQIYFRRDPKVDPLRIESGPSWQACFWSLHFVRCAEALQAAMCAKFQPWSYPHTTSIRGGNLELGRSVFTSLVFLVFKVQKTDPSLWQVEAKAVQTPPWTPELAQVHVTDPASPPCPPKQRSKCQVSAKWRHFCKAASCSFQSLCVCSCCEEWLFYFAESLCAGGAGERAHIWEIVADKVASKPLLIQ